jgi:hypothetical protein
MQQIRMKQQWNCGKLLRIDAALVSRNAPLSFRIQPGLGCLDIDIHGGFGEIGRWANPRI